MYDRWPELDSDVRLALATMVLTIPQVAERLGCNKMAVWHYIKIGRLPAFRVGEERTELQIHARDILRFVDHYFPEYAPDGIERPEPLAQGYTWSALRPVEKAAQLIHVLSPQEVAKSCNWPRIEHGWRAAMRGELIARRDKSYRRRRYVYTAADVTHFLDRCRVTFAATRRHSS